MSSEVFVFVVCGSKEHIETLHLSLKALKLYSKKDIYVLTDSTRNEIPIDHYSIIDIETSKKYNSHQASIFLKTGIHQFLPKGKLYCYLDTDVIAVDKFCDNIFKQYISPISFAADHCKIQAFSSYAVNCSCLNKCAKDRDAYFASVNKHDRNSELTSTTAISYQKKIEEWYGEIKKSFLVKSFYAIRYYLSFPKFWLNKEIYFDKKRKLWATNSGEIVKYRLDVKSIAKEANLKYTLWFNEWKNKKGENIFKIDCDHLTDAIYETFKVEVKDKNWQHWNGGVFLFNEGSHNFLNKWHNKSIQIFNEPEWKTRDQGTLIATAWELGLQNHPTLSKEWNFIADFYNNNLVVSKETNFISDDLFKTTYKAKFVHIFHEWGNEKWEVWSWIKSKIH
ncbi:hypothetical protein N9515_04835 [Vicingaceae bacterium]|nr:hypothetical protein [Vicingaceae bacterium]|tara:strand:+ start:16437 stop:17615 length:1179 start_codon:yes stop_codon:yes gene_type:complete